MSASYVSAVDAIDRWRDDVLTGEKPPRWQLGDGFGSVELGPGLVLLLGGAPGSGKTTLAMQWVVDALRIDNDLRVLVANVESSPGVLLDRQLARLSGITLDLIRERRVTESHGERLADAFDVLDSIAERLAFLESPFSLPNVAAAADATDSKLIVLDYCQRFASDTDNKRHEVNRLMDYLRKFADAGCGLLVLAAVGRTKDRQGRNSYDSNGLGLASFRESSELEFGCDSAYMLAPDKKQRDIVNLVCLKNRHGEPRDIELTFDGSTQRFTTPDSWADSPGDSLPVDVSKLWDIPAGGADYEA